MGRERSPQISIPAPFLLTSPPVPPTPGPCSQSHVAAGRGPRALQGRLPSGPREQGSRSHPCPVLMDYLVVRSSRWSAYLPNSPGVCGVPILWSALPVLNWEHLGDSHPSVHLASSLSLLNRITHSHEPHKPAFLVSSQTLTLQGRTVQLMFSLQHIYMENTPHIFLKTWIIPSPLSLTILVILTSLHLSTCASLGCGREGKVTLKLGSKLTA